MSYCTPSDISSNLSLELKNPKSLRFSAGSLPVLINKSINITQLSGIMPKAIKSKWV
jgi:hypothetical protein